MADQRHFAGMDKLRGVLLVGRRNNRRNNGCNNGWGGQGWWLGRGFCCWSGDATTGATTGGGAGLLSWVWLLLLVGRRNNRRNNGWVGRVGGLGVAFVVGRETQQPAQQRAQQRVGCKNLAVGVFIELIRGLNEKLYLILFRIFLPEQIFYGFDPIINANSHHDYDNY